MDASWPQERASASSIYWISTLLTLSQLVDPIPSVVLKCIILSASRGLSPRWGRAAAEQAGHCKPRTWEWIWQGPCDPVQISQKSLNIIRKYPGYLFLCYLSYSLMCSSNRHFLWSLELIYWIVLTLFWCFDVLWCIGIFVVKPTLFCVASSTDNRYQAGSEQGSSSISSATGLLGYYWSALATQYGKFLPGPPRVILHVHMNETPNINTSLIVSPKKRIGIMRSVSSSNRHSAHRANCQTSRNKNYRSLHSPPSMLVLRIMSTAPMIPGLHRLDSALMKELSTLKKDN